MSSSKAPAALNRQRAMIQSKFPPATARDDDVQWVASDAAASVSSWTQVPQGPSVARGDEGAHGADHGDQTDSDGLKLPPADLKLGAIPEHETADQPRRGMSAPVTQAAPELGGSHQ